jgi:SAM-dependent methyltransferase
MATANPTTTTAENREKLKSHMAQYSGSSYVQGWDELWNKGDFLPWDRGSPSPALADTLLNHAEVIGGPFIDGRRKRALVPGCGRGVDVLLLASFGYDVVGLEYADKALAACEQYVKEHKASYPVKDEKIGQGEMKFVQGDFYKDEWLSKLGWEGWDGKFDLIYDYTVSGQRPPFITVALRISSSGLSDLIGSPLICDSCTFPDPPPLGTICRWPY